MSASSSVGMNLASVTYYSTEFPFIDRMKSAASWSVLGFDSSLIKLNAGGYPTSIPAGASSIYTMVGLDPLSVGISNTYVLTYTGTASFQLNGTKILSSEPGKIVFQYTNTEGNLMPMLVSGLDAASPLSAIHVVRSDQQELFAAGEIFNPTFTDKISAFDTLRYMDWMSANGTSVVKWSDRTKMSDLTWQDVDNSNVPIEVIVALANKTKTNVWLNVPTKADDDYVRQMMTYVRDNLNPSLSVQVEYSNEVWNWAFQQSQYAHREGHKLWGKDANGDGTINPDDPSEQYHAGWVKYYGYRSAQVANIANQVFGADAGRLHNVLATQTGYQGIESYIFEGIAAANVGTPASLFDDYAVTTYFGGVQDVDHATVMSWAQSGEAGIVAALAALKDGTGAPGMFSLATSKPLYEYQARVAAKYGLDLVAYEGGIDLLANTFTAAEQPELMAFFTRLQNDPRIGDLYKQMIDDFSAAGGTLAMAFNDAYPDTKWGTYGTLKSIYDPLSPAWKALVKAQQDAKGSGTTTPQPSPEGPTTPTLPAGFTDQSNYTMSESERVIAFVGTGAFTATGNTLDNTITAGAGGSTLNGGAGTDSLIGGAGADRLDGGVGADTMAGNGGDDVYLVDNTGDVVVEKANGGTDEVRTTLASYALDGDVENLTYTGTAAFTGAGNAGANVITGGNAGNTLSGGAGNDRLNGGSGADTLDGGAGDDVMTGGAGNDVYLADSAGDQVVEAAAAGTDEVRATATSYTLSDNVETLTYVGTAAFNGTGNDGANTITGGAGADKLYGRGGNDELVGGAGDDVLDGGMGEDVMTGALGNDIYVVDSTGDRIVETAGQGTDEVRTTLATFTLGDNLENLTAIGTGMFTGTGNALANVLTAGSGGAKLSGADGNDTLKGGAGIDTLDGGAGDDLLDGGAGDDVMAGALGNDIYVVDSLGDRVVEMAGQGTDEVRTALAALTLADNAETLTYTGAGTFAGTGNASANTLSLGSGSGRLNGGAGNDTLNGGNGADYLDGEAGVDRMVGGAGNDTYVVNDLRDAVVELAGGGTDEIRTALGAYVLTGEVENLTYTGSTQFQAMGNALDNVMTGGAGVNRLLGGDGKDTLYGGASADVLDGGNGADRMSGGGSNDIYFVDNAGDVIVENAGAGIDTAYSSVTYTLSANVENLQLFGGTAIDGTGNDQGNTLFGNAGINKLYGAAGADFLYGGNGGDTLDGGEGDDNVVGEDGNDTLYGGTGDDTLIGGAGDDVLAGGAGIDGLTGNAGADRFVFRPGELDAEASRTDRIFDFSRDEGDKIDLSAFDSNGATEKREAFSFVGTAAFSKKAGELRIDTSGNYQVVSGDLNGDGVADFTLNVSKNVGALIASDFVL